jgi:hypothetical protein
MTNESTFKNKAPSFFDEERERLALIPLHKWLLIFASILIFFVLPLLFTWNSLSVIHPRGYEQGTLFSDAGHVDKTKLVYSKSFSED